VVEGARLESVYTSKGYRGFESLTLRIFYCFRLEFELQAFLCLLVQASFLPFIAAHNYFKKVENRSFRNRYPYT
jgi:hypothetical protein